MLVQIKRWRVTKASMGHLRAAAGVDDLQEGPAVLAGLRKTFGPLGPRIRVFFPEQKRDGPAPVLTPGSAMVVVGIEVEAFDVKAPGLPFAGLVHADPLDAVDMAREDGALRGELERLGIQVEVDQMEWRFSYELKD